MTGSGRGLRELARLVRNETFDEMPLAHLSASAIDFHIASELFKKRRRLKKADLHALHAVTEHHNKLVPTVGGVLLFGDNPEKEFPDAWIQSTAQDLAGVEGFEPPNGGIKNPPYRADD